MATPPPAGIYVPTPTFFSPSSSSSPSSYVDSALDTATQGAYSVYLARAGITGLVLLGSTGEAVHLEAGERGAVIRGVRAALDAAGFAGFPLVAGTAAQSVPEVVRQLGEARAAGAGWGLVLVPGYFAGASCAEGVARWFEAVADRSPLPVMVYHYPGVSNNVPLAPSTLARLAAHPNIVGCKLSHGDVSTHARIALDPRTSSSASFAVFTGLGQQLLPVVAVGAAGAIDGCAGFFPRTVVRLYTLARDPRPGDAELQERRRLQYRVAAVEELVARFGTVGIKEAVSRLRGFGARDGTRLPLFGGLPGGDAEWEKWSECVGAMEEEEGRL
ncbi:aldolase [Xylariomycetidae sp. FL0641]|nr:aldolase [Xylariomycetidae sp. FL0641]